MTPSPSDGDAGYGRVMNELVKAQLSLFAYICALTANSQDARDILQETNLKISKQAASYDPSRPFIKWAKTLAVYEVMTYRKKQQRNRLIFSDDVFDTVVEQAENDHALEIEHYFRFLEQCIDKLPPVLRQVIEIRYLDDCSLRAVAQQLGRTTNAVALLLMRARRALSDCVHLTAEKGEMA